MKAIRFDVSIPRFMVARSLGRVTEAATFGPLSSVKLRDVPEPPVPGDDWAALDVEAAGVCGTDLATLSFATSPALEPFASFPAVPGHEILARVSDRGGGGVGLDAGRRVAVDPTLSCAVRGFQGDDVCGSCRMGHPPTCGHAGEDGETRIGGRPLSRGITIGYHRDLPGGWGPRMVAHGSQLHPVPDEVGDREAVLVEPLSIGLHAVLRSPPHPDEPVLVIGSGPIALGVIWALRATGYEGEVLAQMKREHEAERARALGADDVVAPGFEAREALVETGAMAYQPLKGPEVFAGGGFPWIFDCVGSQSSLAQSLRYAAPRGTLVLLGCAAEFRNLDLTFLWARELELRGFVGYGTEEWRGERRHTFDVALELLREGNAPVGDLVTHAFPLEEYRTALSAAANHARSGAVKVVLKPQS